MTEFRVEEAESTEQATRIAKALNYLKSYGVFYVKDRTIMLSSEKKKLAMYQWERLTAVIVGIKLALKD